MVFLFSAGLRRDLSQKNIDRARNHEHELTYGAVPSVMYQDENGKHGNFLLASYRSICARPEWQKRLGKSYTAGKWIPRSWERNKYELDCANSSDALLMNIFCYPKMLHSLQVCTLLGIEPGLGPEFGFRPRVPLLNARFDQTEVDMRLGNLLVEAKLTETGFQSASTRLFGQQLEVDLWSFQTTVGSCSDS